MSMRLQTMSGLYFSMYHGTMSAPHRAWPIGSTVVPPPRRAPPRHAIHSHAPMPNPPVESGVEVARVHPVRQDIHRDGHRAFTSTSQQEGSPYILWAVRTMT